MAPIVLHHGIAHSMGGLDARYMLSKLGMADRVAALVTICTPHRGSPIADAILGLPGMPKVLDLARSFQIDLDGGMDLTLGSCRSFNDQVEDAPSVRYYSVAAACPPESVPAFLKVPYQILSNLEGPNDGMVSCRSAAWGTLLDTWPVNHFHAVNMRFLGGFGVNVGDMTERYMEVVERVG